MRLCVCVCVCVSGALAGNGIGDEEARALAGALRNNLSLKKLNLSREPSSRPAIQ